MRIDLGDDEQPEISLIALIDCIFFLLMFFMVATTFKHQEDMTPKALAIKLPESAVSLDKTTAATDWVAIGVDAKGGVYWGSEPVSKVVLRERLHAAAQKNPNQPVRIDGDTQAPYQNIVHLLDLCQFEGLTQIAMRTRNGR
jgi:biopolymer transport protein ExbD